MNFQIRALRILPVRMRTQVTLAGEDAILLGNMQSPNSGLLERVAQASNMTQAHGMHDAWTWAELWQYTQGWPLQIHVRAVRYSAKVSRSA